jgi:hypothetical protein
MFTAATATAIENSNGSSHIAYTTPNKTNEKNNEKKQATTSNKTANNDPVPQANVTNIAPSTSSETNDATMNDSEKYTSNETKNATNNTDNIDETTDEAMSDKDNEEKSVTTASTTTTIHKNISSNLDKINEVCNDTNKWKDAPTKRNKKKSLIEIPQTIPAMESEYTAWKSGEHELRITVKIAAPTNIKPNITVKLNPVKFLKGLFTHILRIEPGAYLTSHSLDRNDDPLEEPNKIDDEIIDHFLAPAIINKNSGLITTRLVLNCNKHLYELKQDPNLLSWLETERISLYRNNLKSINPRLIGFLTKWYPREDTAAMNEARLCRQIVEDFVSLQLQPAYISSGGIRTKVYHIYTEPEEAHKTTKLLLKLNTTERIFTDYNRFRVQPIQAQVPVLEPHITSLDSFKSILITGFHPDYYGPIWNDEYEIYPLCDEHGTIQGYRIQLQRRRPCTTT